MDASRDDGVNAWRRSAVVAARLQRHEKRGTGSRRTGLAEGNDLGVRLAGRLRPALTDDRAGLDDDGPHGRVGAAPADGPSRELKGPLHIVDIRHTAPALDNKKATQRHTASSVAQRSACAFFHPDSTVGPGISPDPATRITASRPRAPRAEVRFTDR